MTFFRYFAIASVVILLSLSTPKIDAFSPDDLLKFKQTNRCPNCDLNSADLNDRDMRGADLTGANLSGADLSSANMSDAWLSRADLHGAIGTIKPLTSSGYAMNSSGDMKPSPDVTIYPRYLCSLPSALLLPL